MLLVCFLAVLAAGKKQHHALSTKPRALSNKHHHKHHNETGKH